MTLKLEGKKFGRLTVIKRVENNKSAHSRWMCQCSCGNSSVVEGRHLKCKNTESCGCKRGLELEGQKFGHLTVISREENSASGRRRWLCKCSCGNYTVVIGSELKFKNRISCGCRHGLSPQSYIKSKIKIDKDGKWLWQDSLDKDGYGWANWKGKHWRAHRLAYTIFVGEIPPGMFVCHKNDFPQDVNPANLFLGSPQDNMDDKTRKGRGMIGGNHGMSKLLESQVIEIRKMLSDGISTVKLAKDFGVHKSTISLIKTGKNWKHI